MQIKSVKLALAGISAAATVAVFSGLPSEMPVHWNAAGEVDTYAPKSVVLLTGALPLLLFGLQLLLERTKYGAANEARNSRVTGIAVTGAAMLVGVLHWLSVLHGTGHAVDMVLFVKAGVGLLFLVLGNYLPKLQPNAVIGIRFPWTMRSPQVWRRVHRVAGWAFAGLGAAFLAGAFLPHRISFYILVPLTVLVLGGILLHSRAAAARGE